MRQISKSAVCCNSRLALTKMSRQPKQKKTLESGRCLQGLNTDSIEPAPLREDKREVINTLG
jgi:hypothetical protein